jgi:predicted DNA-binding protein (UPF0251 family)
VAKLINVARPQKNRKISNPPKMCGFKPYGMPVCKPQSIRLTFEEYEAIRLVLYEKMPQENASEHMNISRPTLTRIYNKAIQTVAIALMECKTIEIEGGNYHFDKQWYRCTKCHKLIQGITNHKKCKDCKFYSENELICLNRKEMQQ